MSTRNLAVLKRAYQLLLDRGWNYTYSSGPNSTMNIRSAVSAACTQLVTQDGQWHKAYMQAIATIQHHLQDGVLSWEFGTHAAKPRRRTQDEVYSMFDKLIRGLEFNEKQARVRVSSGSDRRTV